MSGRSFLCGFTVSSVTKIYPFSAKTHDFSEHDLLLVTFFRWSSERRRSWLCPVELKTIILQALQLDKNLRNKVSRNQICVSIIKILLQSNKFAFFVFQRNKFASKDSVVSCILRCEGCLFFLPIPRQERKGQRNTFVSHFCSDLRNSSSSWRLRFPITVLRLQFAENRSRED